MEYKQISKITISEFPDEEIYEEFILNKKKLMGNKTESSNYEKLEFTLTIQTFVWVCLEYT